MSGTLDKIFVSIGVKGQDVVLKTIDKIKKDAGGLSKINAIVNTGKGNISKSITKKAGGKSNPYKSISEVISKTGKNNPSNNPSNNPVDAPENVTGTNKLGVKGQGVALKNIAKIKKEAIGPSKVKANINLDKGNILKPVANIAGGRSMPKMKGITGNPPAPSGQPMAQPVNTPENPAEKKENANKKFFQGVNKFAGSSKEFVQGVSHFDPVSAVQQAISSTGSALGAMVKAIPVVGDYLKELPKGLADVTNAFVGMGVGALQMAKDTTSNQFSLSNRNATTKNYNGDKISQDGMSRSEHSQLVMSIAGSYGKLQGPMVDALNELVKSKNTEALGRVASGNWQSTGTNKGWMLQQISNQTQGLPPEIAQAIQASLLNNNSSEIQDKGEESGAQVKNATFQNQSEDQTTNLYGKLDDKAMTSLKSLNDSLNKMQESMFDAGLGMATQIDKASGKIKELTESFDKMRKAVNDFSIMGYSAPSLLKELFK
jgi:hypothetical protein